MHELSILVAAIKSVEEIMDENHLEEVQTIVFDVGEVSGVVPAFLEKLYPAATHNTRLEGSSMRVEIVPGDARCRECGQTYNLPDNDGFCPYCGSRDFDVLSGDGFTIKELIAK